MRYVATGMSILLHTFVRRHWQLWVTVAIVATLGTCCWTLLGRPQSRFGDIQRALAEQRWTDAESLARSRLELYPNDIEARMALGDALQHLGSIAEAAEIYRQVPDNAGEHRTTAQLAIVSILLRQGRLAEAEARLRAINLDPLHTDIANGLSVTLLSLSGRQWESIPYLQRTLNKVGDRLMTLIYLANPDEMPAPSEDVFAKMLRIRDPLGLHGCARIAASVGRKEQALILVRECLSKQPDFVEAQLTLGTLLIDSGNEAEFEDWLANLPEAADEHPTTWLLRGRRAQDRNDYQEAIRCYWEVLRRQPNDDRATYQLGQLLSGEGRIDDGRIFSERSKRLKHLIELSVKLYEQRGAKQEIAECAQATHELGRLQECRAWCDVLQTVAADDSTSLQLVKTLRDESRDDSPWLQPAADLASRFDLSSYPLPKKISRDREARYTEVRKPGQSRIAFADDARRVGLDFVYFNGDDPLTRGKRMFEFTGGGVAAIDYDLDGWCDVYFTQGTTWPPQPQSHQYLDAMFRNMGGQLMQDVSTQIGIQDAGYGQGVAANDYDNDGFADLYVANIDGNRLYRNQGDGTFLDVTKSSGIGTHSHWTTSCLVTDLNGDSLPDVFDVCYLDGKDVFSRICEGVDGVPSSCPPAIFPAAPDHVYTNLGDGTFREMTHDWGFDVPNGDGLGIIAGDFDDSGTISLFVGNDGRANFFFVPETMTTGQVHWSEIGVISGLAYDDTGAAQACMGIAAGDANNDGRLDLFVTNFYNESNTLYINLGSRTFTDRSRSTGVRDASWSMLGFGTQFVDADHDGWEDIILVNGHVDDFTHNKIPYKMRPQFLHNQKTRFVEQFGKDVGPFFDEPRLGRGLARLDWNRDGMNDVAISHIGDPAALLTNRTQKAGRGLGLKLVGTTRSRDAIGTRVTVRTGVNQLTRQLTGGDGYQASNERRLEFGLAEYQDNVEVEIRWMGGAVETLKVELNDQEYIAIEGRGELLRLRAD